MNFTRQAVEEVASLHDEPEWLRARRRQAFEVFERLELPSRDEEEWRRTDLKGLDLASFAAFEEPDGQAPADSVEGAVAVLRQRGSAAGTVELDPDLARKGVLFMPLTQAAREQRELIEKLLFTEVSPERDKFAALHAAFFSGGSFLYVPAGVSVEQPFVSQFWSAGGGAAVLPHTLILAGEGATFYY